MSVNDCTVMVCSCDAYDDLWNPFFTLFYEYWRDCPYRIILNTESKSFSYMDLDIECLNLYKKGTSVSYGKRMLDHLAYVDTPYILIIMDDFFIQEKVNNEKIDETIEYLKNNDEIAFFKFSPNKDPLNQIDSRFPEYEKRPRYGEYRHSMQAGVWRTEYFMKTWKKSESPWNWEVWGTYRSINDKWDYYCLKDGVTPPIEYGYDFDKGGSLNVCQGKWTHGTYEEVFRKHGIVVDFEKRGWYDGHNLDQNIDSYFIKEWKRFRSAGAYMWTKIYFWRIRKSIIKKMGFPVYATYMDYKRKDKSKLV